MPLLNARQLSPSQDIEADVCVIGGGPVGLTLSRELAGQGWTVALLESGGVELEPEAQRLAEGRTTGDPFQRLVDTRVRRLGGTPYLWNTGAGIGEPGFRNGLLHEADMEAHDWLPHSVGWPFSLADLRPYYERAQVLCGLGPCRYSADDWACEGAQPWPLDPALFQTSVWQLGVQGTFTEKLRAEVERHPNVTIYIHATVAELRTVGEGQEVSGVRVLTAPGREITARARRYVLAAGGIENARLLLLSRGDHPNGLGNDAGLVGRFFMEHQWVHGGRLVPAERSTFAGSALYDTREVDGSVIVGKIDFTDDALRRHQLLNISAAVVPRHRWGHRFTQEVPNAAVEIPRALASGAFRDAARHLLRVLGGLDYFALSSARRLTGGRLFDFARPSPDLIAGTSWSALPNPERRWHHFDVVLHCEQAPHPDNRVRLEAERDALGIPRATLHWEWRETDQRAVSRAQGLLQEGLARSGIGRYVPEFVDGRPVLRHAGLHHHMGTTRMHPSPARGVVDEQGRVHGVANLYVSGLSTFPSGGYINPTLTIVALAMRLGDHLHTQMSMPPAALA